MAESIVSSVVIALGDLLIQEVNFLGGVREQVERMQTELKLMQGFLEDADKRQDEDKRVQAWISEIREAAYDAQVVMETFALKISSSRRRRIGGVFKRYACIFNEATEIHKLSSQIESITTKITNLTRCLQTYGIRPTSEGEGSISSSVQRQFWRQSYAHVVEDFTIGLDEDREILVAQLVNEKENCVGVVSICGMGGVGKTTLAKKVFHHFKSRRYFDAFAWAYVSQQFQPRHVLEGILFELISPSKEQREEILKLRYEEVAKKLYQVQQEKKCLVIIDDIWRSEAWDALSPAFPIGKAGSKVLLTSRNKEVALHVDPTGFLHEPRCLNEEESWELLQNKAFPQKHDPGFKINLDMEKLGRKMVGRCAGLPLAIIVLGGLLATKHTLKEWDMVHDNIISCLRRAKGHEQQHSGVFEVLALSYHELPYQLKPCFLHLGHFPEDFEISTKKLARMWVAEGIVSSMQYGVEEEETLEDIAQHYLGELMDRCMVQVGVRGSTGRVKTCRLHDLMRDLCLSKANQENFLKIVHLRDQNTQVGSLSSSHQVHRLAVYLGERSLKIFPKQERTLYLRSLSFFSTHNDGTKIPQEVHFKLNEFKFLKILDLEQCVFKGNFTSAIGNLIHLRYLSLRFYDSTNFPSSIGNLRCLQTLILRGYGVTIANVLWKMEKLRHLYLPRHIKKSYSKLQLGNLKDLQTLQGFDTSICDIKGLTKLSELKKLGIVSWESTKELVEVLRSSSVTFNGLFSLQNMWFNRITLEETDLRALLSSCPRLYKLELGGLIEKLPEFYLFPPNLTKLILLGCELEENSIATLEKLPNLSILCLGRDSFIGKKMICSPKGFPQLKSLEVAILRNLEEWYVGEEAMPCLSELKIVDCEKLRMVPDGLRFITTLQELQILKMSQEFKTRLQGGEDSFKVQHVPSIIFKE